jgi:hypothetical protein
VLPVIAAVSSLTLARSRAEDDLNRFYVPELGGYLGKEWKDYIGLARRSPETGVFEEYWGLWSATRRIFPSWPVDSVIHALGGTRMTSRDALRSATVIVSTRYATAPDWQPWSLSQNYWFYETLLKDWAPSVLSPTTIVWHKGGRSRPFVDADCSLDSAGSTSLILRAPRAGFYEVDMQYGLSGSGRFIAMIRNNISFVAESDGYVSIDPRATSAKFPVYVEKSGLATLDTKIIGSSKHDLLVKSCAAKYIQLSNEEVLHPPDHQETSVVSMH